MPETITQVAILVVLGLNVGGLAWGAAKISTTLKGTVKELGRLRDTVTDIQDVQGRLITRVAVLEEKAE